MAVLAVHLVGTSMDLVAEVDGLHGAWVAPSFTSKDWDTATPADTSAGEDDDGGDGLDHGGAHAENDINAMSNRS
jgi:hypothetical protein